MQFRTRNTYYLRISANTILPLYIYLDEQHVEWMSDRVLQLVLEDLRLRIPEKLMNEADVFFGRGSSSNANQSSLDVYRGDSYQFGYFLRKTDPHAVVIKTRHFVAAPQRKLQPPPSSPQPRATTPKRKRRNPKRKAEAPGNANKKRKTKGKQRANSEEEEAIVITSDEEDIIQGPDDIPEQLPSRRSTRVRKVVAGGYRETEDDGTDSAPMDVDIPPPLPIDPMLDDPTLIPMDESEDNINFVKTEETEPRLQGSASLPATPPLAESTLLDDDEEEKPKPILKLSYQNFNIHGQCLCVIIEPYPPIRTAPKPMSLVREGLVGPRAPSAAPTDRASSIAPSRREQTPLFLPDDDGDRGQTPAPFLRTRPAVPLFHEEPTSDDEGQGDGMYELSQILRTVGGYPAGATEDDDEIEGAVFFGDADEAREL